MAWFVFSQHCFKSVPLVRAASTAAADLKHPQIVAGFYGEPLRASPPRTELRPTRSTVSERTGADDVTAARVSSNRVIRLTARSIGPTWSDGPRRALSEDATWVDWSQLPSCPNQTVFFCSAEQISCTCIYNTKNFPKDNSLCGSLFFFLYERYPRHENVQM